MGKNFCNIGYKWCKFCRRNICNFSQVPVDSLTTCPRVDAISTVQFADLLKQVNFETVFATLVSYFPSQAESKIGYKQVFDTILEMKPEQMTNLNDLFISVKLYNEDGHDYLDVDGVHVNSTDKKFYGIEFCPWKDWISMHITQETLDTLSKEDIVAGCLYEMTFFGFTDESVQEERNRLIKSIEEIKTDINNK